MSIRRLRVSRAVGITVLLLHFVSLLGVPLHFVLEPHGVCGDTICHVPAIPDAGTSAAVSRVDEAVEDCQSHRHSAELQGEHRRGAAADSHASLPRFDREDRSDSRAPFACGLVDSFQPQQGSRVELDPIRLDDAVGTAPSAVVRWLLTPKFPLFRLAPKNSPGLES